MMTVSKPDLGLREATAVQQCIADGQITHGPRVERFEHNLAWRVGFDYGVAVTSGTTALHLALAAMGVGPGDEVIVPDLTFVSTAFAVLYTGATPVLVDVDPAEWTIDARWVRKVTTKTKCVIPVHLYGVRVDPDVRAQAKQYDVAVLDDSAEYLGARHQCTEGTHCFSFYGNKVMTTGEGGAVLTNDHELAEKMRHLRGVAQTSRRYFHDAVGFNYRMTDLQAALGNAQLSRLDEMLLRRTQVFQWYRERLVGYGMEPGLADKREFQAPWLFTLYVGKKRRDYMMDSLRANDIETRPTFVPLHRMPMFIGNDGDFPTASQLGDGGLSLPTHSQMTEEDVDRVCRVFKKVWQ